MVGLAVPLSEPDITDLEVDAVVAVLRGTQLSLGPKMEEFEQRLSAYVGVSYGIAVSSGTSGLHLCVRALGIGLGDEVILPSFTFVAAANAIRFEGAVPIFVDIEAATLNMSPSCIEAAITARTRAIVVVHTFGVPAAINPILEIARRHGLRVIEDACEAIGAEYGDRRVGSFGDAAVFAFYPNKQITTGEGGMIVTRDENLAAKVRAMRNQGRYPSDGWHQHSVLGFNYRLSEMNCALGCAQMQRIEAILRKRTAVAKMYREHLDGVDGLTLPPDMESFGRMSWFVYVVRISGDGSPSVRDRVAKSLMEDGVQCGRYFAPLHQQQVYAGFPVTQPLPVTEAESRRTLALPFFSNMILSQVSIVADRLRTALAASQQR